MEDRQFLKKMYEYLVECMMNAKPEENILSLIKKHPDLMLITNSYGKTLGMHAVDNGYTQVALLTLKFDKACLKQDKDGYNVGMLAAQNGNEVVFHEAKRNKKLREQACKTGKTMMDFGRYYEMLNMEDLLAYPTDKNVAKDVNETTIS